MSKIIYTQENGVVAVVHPSDQSLKEMTIEEIAERVVPVGTTYSIVADSVIPTDRSFRNSWVGVGIGSTSETTITEDMTKAKELHKAKIREARVDKFAELDVEYQRATETSADTSDIVAKKQALRDAPAASGITTAVNTTDLKAQWDTSILGSNPYYK
tara:strand:+ start:617 stop:1090 length:474 start_codon:yes stop_codon:yes gene_type:complete